MDTSGYAYVTGYTSAMAVFDSTGTTRVRLFDTRATRQGDAMVIEWTAAFDPENLSFDVYRAGPHATVEERA